MRKSTMKKVLVFSPHPDDETLGCGGTLLKHSNDEDQLYWCILTYGNEKMGHDEEHYKKWDKIIKKVSNADSLLTLPIDQRYGPDDMNHIADTLKKVI